MTTHDNCPRYPSFAECRLRYNLADSEREVGEGLHQTEPDIPPVVDTIEDSEYRRITQAIAPVIEKHNRQHGYIEESSDCYYLLATWFRGDRTIEVMAYGKAAYTCELVNDLQLLLHGEFRLWRILLESNVIDDLVLVYPETVRNNDAIPGEPLAELLQRVNDGSGPQCLDQKTAYIRWMGERPARPFPGLARSPRASPLDVALWLNSSYPGAAGI